MSRPECIISVFKTQEMPKSFVQLIQRRWNDHCLGVSRNVTTRCSGPRKGGQPYGVGSSYGRRAIPNSDYVIVAHTSKRMSLCGFVLLQHKVSLKMGYIDVICSGSRYGTDLLTYAEQFCKTQLGCDFMKLSALSEIIWWYEKNGYNHVDFPCHPNRVSKCKPVRIPGYREGSHVDNFSGNYNAGDGWRMTKCLNPKPPKRSRNNNRNLDPFVKRRRESQNSNSTNNNSQKSLI
jgi:hypothetical protein